MGQEAAIRSEFAAADVVLKGQMEVYTDGAVDGEKVRAEAAELALSNAIDAEEAARIAAVSAEATSRSNADAGLAADILTEKNRAEGEEAAIRGEFAAADLVLKGQMESYTDGEISTLEAAVEAAANAETLVREGEEARIEGKHDAYVVSNNAALAAEISRAQAAELVNSNAISNEKQRAEGVEAGLAQDIADEQAGRIAAVNAEQSARTTAVADLQSQLDAEIAATNADFVSASNARGVIAAGLAQELLDRAAEDAQGLADAKAYTDAEITSMETAFTAALDAEIAATNADFIAAEQARVNMNTQLTADIATAKSEAIAHTDAAVAGLVDSAPAMLDTLNELAAAIGDDENFAATVASDIATAKSELEGQVDAVEAALATHEASNVASFNAASTDRTAIRSELAAEKATLQGEMAAADAVVTAAFEAADLAMKTELEGDLADLASDLGDEIAARVAGDLSVTAAFEAADLAEKNRAEAVELQLTNDLSSEVARATAKENEIEAKQDQMIDGQVKVNFLANAVASAALTLAAGFEYHIVQNSGASAGAELPVLQPNYKVTVSLAAASAEPMNFAAPAGKTIDGEVDGVITMYPGSSVTFVEHGGVYYMM